ncbi:MAG: hypothetical protein KDE19_15245 [Caldilineaceae bacterium]|nr:hypothetical protein [Caldilineaceae bacterium]
MSSQTGNDYISGETGEGSQGTLIGKDSEQRNQTQTVNLPSLHNPVDLSRMQRTVDELESAVFGNRGSMSPGLGKVLESVLDRLTRLEREVAALREELRDLDVRESGQELSQRVVWAVLAVLSLNVVAIVAGFLYIITTRGGG